RGSYVSVYPSPGPSDPLAADLDQLVDRVIVAQRVVMGEGLASGVRRDGVIDGRLGGRVAPADFLGILLRRVLRVMDHEVGAVDERDVPGILGVKRGYAP